jgi:hypothetical protein
LDRRGTAQERDVGDRIRIIFEVDPVPKAITKRRAPDDARESAARCIAGSVRDYAPVSHATWDPRTPSNW